MSTQAALHFLRAIRQDAALRRQVAALRDQGTLAGIAALGCDHGWSVSEDELRSAVKHDWGMRSARDRPKKAIEAVAETSLCQACGLCCDGTMFGWAALTWSERVDALRQSGVTIEVRNHEEGIRQPCAALEGTCCRIYRDRPQTCRHYRCRLLTAHEQGRVSRGDAEAVVARARSLAQALRAEVQVTASDLTGVALADLPQHIPRRQVTGPSPADDAVNRLLLQWATLRAHLRKHFGAGDAP